MDILKKIILTYGSDWEKMPAGQTNDIWRTLDTVMNIKKMLSNMSYNVKTMKVDTAFEEQLKKIKKKDSDTLIYWLNEFINPEYTRSPENFTVNIIERIGLPHTGSSSKILALGLNKYRTKQLFNELGIKTPDCYIVNIGNLNIINEHDWDFPVIIKPLLHGDSLGIGKKSVVNGNNYRAIRKLVSANHLEFEESVLVEKFIGGDFVQELTIPVLIDHLGRIVNLPFIEMDFTKISPDQKYKFIYDTLKMGIIPIKILSKSNETIDICKECNKIIKKMKCVDFARLDIRINESGRFYIEVNAYPSKNRGSYFAISANYLGIKPQELLAFSPHQAMLKYGLEVTSQLEQFIEPILNVFYKKQ